MTDEPLDNALPVCPADLVQLEPAGPIETPYWRCLACGLVRMTA
jgi:ferredoxin-like protein FixX